MISAIRLGRRRPVPPREHRWHREESRERARRVRARAPPVVEARAYQANVTGLWQKPGESRDHFRAAPEAGAWPGTFTWRVCKPFARNARARHGRWHSGYRSASRLVAVERAGRAHRRAVARHAPAGRHRLLDHQPARCSAPHLARTLQHEHGFVCVDLHPPTDVDALAALAAQGARVHVYYEDIPTYTDRGRKEPPALLHAKMLLFWTTGGAAELWAGSHNFTNRALLGLNVEASLVVRLTDTSPLFAAASAYLAHMQAIAEPFDLAKVDVYKQLQRTMTTGLTPVMELDADGRRRCQPQHHHGVRHRPQGPVERWAPCVARSTSRCWIRRTDAQSLYPATILHSGLLPASDAAAGGISFAPRRFAYRTGQQRPALQAVGAVDAAVLNAAEYFVTVHLGELQPGLVAEPPAPRAARMAAVAEEVSPLLARLDAEARAQLFGRREVRVRRPVVATDEAPPRSGLARPALAEHPLVAMRVLTQSPTASGRQLPAERR